jgi:hypothetical protein
MVVVPSKSLEELGSNAVEHICLFCDICSLLNLTVCSKRICKSVSAASFKIASTRCIHPDSPAHYLPKARCRKEALAVIRAHDTVSLVIRQPERRYAFKGVMCCNDVLFGYGVLAESSDYLILGADQVQTSKQDLTFVNSTRAAVVRSKRDFRFLGFIPDQHTFFSHVYHDPNGAEFLITGGFQKVSAVNLSKLHPVLTIEEASSHQATILHQVNGTVLQETLRFFCASGNLFGFSNGRQIDILKLAAQAEECSPFFEISPEFVFQLDLGASVLSSMDIDVMSGMIAVLKGQVLFVYDLNSRGLLFQKTLILSGTHEGHDEERDDLRTNVRLKHGFMAIGSNEGILYVYQLHFHGVFELLFKFQDDSFLRTEEIDVQMLIDIHYGKLAITDGRGCGLKLFDLLSSHRIRSVLLSDCYDAGHIHGIDEFVTCSCSLKWSDDGLKIYLTAHGGSLHVWNFSPLTFNSHPSHE